MSSKWKEVVGVIFYLIIVSFIPIVGYICFRNDQDKSSNYVIFAAFAFVSVMADHFVPTLVEKFIEGLSFNTKMKIPDLAEVTSIMTTVSTTLQSTLTIYGTLLIFYFMGAYKKDMPSFWFFMLVPFSILVYFLVRLGFGKKEQFIGIVAYKKKKYFRVGPIKFLKCHLSVFRIFLTFLWWALSILNIIFLT